MTKAQPDVLVIGAGMVGATAASLFARAGLRVCVLESKAPARFDPESPVGLRVSAISPGSMRILAEAGAWQAVEDHRHAPYRRMRVEDRIDGAALDFNAGEFGLERLGTIVENDLLQWALWQNLQQLAAVETLCPAEIESLELLTDQPVVRLAGGRALRPKLVVGADGGQSQVRAALGVGEAYTAYGQKAVVAVVRTQRANSGVAWQRFLPGGPLAFLPLGDGRSSIVWSRPATEADRLADEADENFCRALSDAVTGTEFGSVLEAGPRAAFPLALRLVDRYAVRRCVLVGDAAHVIHPLAGQGVNLGFLDAAALVETALRAHREAGDIGDERRLEAFGRWRRSEAEIMARGIHALHALFLPEALGPLRRLGLGVVGRNWALRELFIRRAAGLNRDAPALSRGVSLQDLVIP